MDLYSELQQQHKKAWKSYRRYIVDDSISCQQWDEIVACISKIEAAIRKIEDSVFDCNTSPIMHKRHLTGVPDDLFCQSWE